MNIRKLKKRAYKMWRPNFKQIMQKIIKKYSSKIVENITANNVLFQRLAK